jgi:hypothetical protein
MSKVKDVAHDRFAPRWGAAMFYFEHSPIYEICLVVKAKPTLDATIIFVRARLAGEVAYKSHLPDVLF